MSSIKVKLDIQYHSWRRVVPKLVLSEIGVCFAPGPEKHVWGSGDINVVRYGMHIVQGVP